MDPVQAGDVLLELDDTNAKLSFEQAKSNLANAVRQISQLNYTVKQLKSAVRANEITLAQAQGNLNRRVQLVKDGAIDKESFQHAKEAVELVKKTSVTNSTALLNAPFASVSIRSMLTNRSAVLWFCPMVLVNPRLFLFLPAVQKLRKLRMQVLTLLVLKSSLTRSKAAGSTLSLRSNA